MGMLRALGFGGGGAPYPAQPMLMPFGAFAGQQPGGQPFGGGADASMNNYGVGLTQDGQRIGRFRPHGNTLGNGTARGY